MQCVHACIIGLMKVRLKGSKVDELSIEMSYFVMLSLWMNTFVIVQNHPKVLFICRWVTRAGGMSGRVSILCAWVARQN